jgi:hypothetical protein
MAQVFNDRDLQLQNSSVRLVLLPQNNFIKLTSDYAYFTIVNGLPTVNQLVITAELFGQLVGTPVFSVVSGSTGLVDIQVVGDKTIAVLPYYSLTAEVAVIRASLNYLGVTYTSEITLGGQLAPPATVIANTPQISGSLVYLSWNKNTDADISGYEVRDTNSNWGVDNNYIFRGNANSCFASPGAFGVSKSWYIKAYDTSGIYSTNATTISYTVQSPNDISNIFHEYADTSLTNATVTLRWLPVSPEFGLKEYLISYIDKYSQLKEVAIRSTSITLDADWVGDRLFTVKTVDNLGNISSGYSEFITKSLPNKVLNMRSEVIDSSVLLYWTLPEKTSLPISHVVLKRSTDSVSAWEDATLIGIKDGEFTNVHELSGGTYRYWIKTVDTDGNESEESTSITVKVNPPADYIFNGEFASTFSGTKVNAYLDGLDLVLPVNTSETWEQHYVNNGFSSPNTQINAGYPIYAQPAISTGSYEEIFDMGNGLPVILGSSNVTVAFNNNVIAGSCTTRVVISVSSDGIVYNQNTVGLTGFFTNFRFIKVRIEVQQNSVGSLVAVSELDVRVDTKIKTDSATATISSSDTNGTIVNFRSEFIDVISVNITPSSSVVRIPVYQLNDTIITATYTASGGLFTITCPDNITNDFDHGLYPGQNVRIATATGSIPVLILPVTTRTSRTVFTVAYSGATSGSGTVYLYPQGMRVYLLNAAGGLESGRVSWTVRGS